MENVVYTKHPRDMSANELASAKTEAEKAIRELGKTFDSVGSEVYVIDESGDFYSLKQDLGDQIYSWYATLGSINKYMDNPVMSVDAH